MPNTSVLNSTFEARQGIERWENEGGRIRVGAQISGPSHRRTDANRWVPDFSKVARVTRKHLSFDPTLNFLAASGEALEVANRQAVVLLGPPGSGKTSLVRDQAEINGLAAIETGNLLKQEIRHGTPLGRHIKAYTDVGALVPSALVSQIISTELESLQDDLILFDGFPRSLEQIGLFFQLLKNWQLDLGAVLVLTLDLPTAIERLGRRRICARCGTPYNLHSKQPQRAGECDQCEGKLIQRRDDTADVIAKRFQSYELETVPVIEYFRANFGPLVWEAPAFDQIG